MRVAYEKQIDEKYHFQIYCNKNIFMRRTHFFSYETPYIALWSNYLWKSVYLAQI